MTMPGAPDSFRWALQVQRSEFAQALRTVSRAGKGLREAQALLSFEDGDLAIEIAGSSARIPAQGNWPSEVRLPGDVLAKLARSLPEEDPLSLRVEGKRFFAARFSIPCEWRMYSHKVSTPVKELLAANADLFEILMLRSRCSAEEIDAAGAASLMSDAESRLEAICQKAAQALNGYGVTTHHLRRLCWERATDGTRKFQESDRTAIRQIARAWELLAPLGVEPNELKALMDYCLRNAWRNPK